jgi:hydroxyquinol 1,2-dioxygenase
LTFLGSSYPEQGNPTSRPDSSWVNAALTGSGYAAGVADLTPTRTTPADITAAVIASFDEAGEARLRELMQALARHLHAFVDEVNLTEDEWRAAIGVLTATGHITDERRQEFILWSDSLGLSMLVDAVANPLPAGATESTVLGPFYVPGSPEREYGESMAAEPAGTPAWVYGRVLDTDGEPIAGAELDVWQNGDDQLYAVQRPEAPEDHLRGRYRTREDGSYAFLAVRPVPYPIPYDGPVGKMLEATGRHPWRPAHIHMIVRAPGYRTVTTHIFDRDSEYLDSDAVFAVKPSLLREFVERDGDDPERPAGVDGAWVSVENEIVLAPGEDSGDVVDPGRTA